MAILVLNRLRIVLAEKNKKSVWLVQQLGVSATTVSKWMNNVQQPPLKTFYDIARLLDVDLRELIVSTK